MVTAYCCGQLALYANIESQCCTNETNINGIPLRKINNFNSRKVKRDIEWA